MRVDLTHTLLALLMLPGIHWAFFEPTHVQLPEVIVYTTGAYLVAFVLGRMAEME